MCDPGEKIQKTLKREFMEEAIDSLGKNKANLDVFEAHLNDFFENSGIEVIRQKKITIPPISLYRGFGKILIFLSI
jgi:hypothetical protein